ncbi:MAG: ATP-binding protein [Anaerolineales bacterium]
MQPGPLRVYLLLKGPSRRIRTMQFLARLIRRLAPRSVLLMSAIGGSYLVWLLLVPRLPELGWVSFLWVALARSVSAAAVVYVAREMWTSRLQRAWVFLAAGMLLWLFAEVARDVMWYVVNGQPTIPSLSDFLRLAGGGAIAAGMTLFPSGAEERFGRIRRLLDISMISVSILALAWLVLVRPALEVGLAQAYRVAWVGIEVSLDLLLVALATRLFLVSLGGKIGRRAAFLAGGFLLTTVSDLTFGYLMLSHDWLPGSLIELGWIGGSLLLVAAAADQLSQRSDPFSGVQEGRWSRAGRRLDGLLPVASLYAVAGYTVVDGWLFGRVDWVGVVASIALTLLFLVRQGAIAGQMEMRQYAALVNATTDMAFICTPEGALRLYNPAMRRRLGLPLPGGPRIEMSHFTAAPVNLKELLGRATEEGWTGELTFSDADGQAFPVSLSLQPIVDERQEQPLIVATAYDLTDIKARETQLKMTVGQLDHARAELQSMNTVLEQKVDERTRELAAMVVDLEKLNQELQQLDQLKSDFVTLVSHELRAPLTNIRSGVELILETGKSVPEDSQETLTLVKDETERLSHFVETILDLSALEAGRFPLTIMPVPVAEVTRAVVSRFPKESGGERVQLALPEDLPPVEADEQSFASVLFHLLDNALKYAPSGEVIIGAEVKDNGLRFWVTDEGPGIPAKSRQTVFDRFHRLDTSDSREVYGHGLGLHLCRRLIEAMGGWIEADESHAGGAKLVFWLPLARVPAG